MKTIGLMLFLLCMPLMTFSTDLISLNSKQTIDDSFNQLELESTTLEKTLTLESRILKIEKRLTRLEINIAKIMQSSGETSGDLVSRLEKLESAISVVDNKVMINRSVVVNGDFLEVNVSTTRVNSPVNLFSGLVKASILEAEMVTSTLYTSGAGNLW